MNAPPPVASCLQQRTTRLVQDAGQMSIAAGCDPMYVAAAHLFQAIVIYKSQGMRADAVDSLIAEFIAKYHPDAPLSGMPEVGP